MSDPLSHANLPETRHDFGKPEVDTPFRIAVFGDFSGRANRGAPSDSAALVQRPAIKISYENLDDVLAELAPALRLPLEDGAAEASLTFGELDDFEPDPVIRQVELFDDRRGDDTASANLLREILHHPDYRSLESSWRGLAWLLRRTAKSDHIQVLMFDVTAAEFAADLTASDQLADSAIYQWLVQQPIHQLMPVPWAALVGGYTFDASAEHAQVLYRIGQLAMCAGAPFVSGVGTAIFDEGAELPGPAADAWQALRQQPEASYLSLAAPRFLLRQPFGANYKSPDGFDFEELTGQTSDYLWGSAGVAIAGLLAGSFVQRGWDFRPGNLLRLDGMPMHAGRDAQGDELAVTCERQLTSSVAARGAALGVIPLLAVRGRDVLELAAIRSLHAEHDNLPGPWQQAAGLAAPAGRHLPGASVGLMGGAVKPGAPVRGGGSYTTSTPARPAASEEPASSETDGELEDQSTDSDAEPEAAPDTSVDDELAALMASLDEPAPAAAPADTSVDDELAALMASLDESAPAAAPADTSVDDDLAALMAELDAPMAAAEPDSSVDDDLAALLAELDSPPADAPPAADEPVAEVLDDDLAALMASLEAVAEPTPEAATDEGQNSESDLGAVSDENSGENADSSAESIADDELAAMMASLDMESEPESVSAAESSPSADDVDAMPAVDSILDDELAAMMAALDTEPETETAATTDDLPSEAPDSGEISPDELAGEAAAADNAASDSDDASELADLETALASAEEPADIDDAALAAVELASAATNDFVSATNDTASSAAPAERRNVDQTSQPKATATAHRDTRDDDSENPMNDEANVTGEVDLEAAVTAAQGESNYGGAESGSSAILDFRQLLEPISPDEPAGGSVPYAVRENLEQYRKDINPDMFAADDPTRPTDIVKADWPAIIDLAQQTLINDSKNLLVASRLLEALAQQYGFAGLRDGLLLMRLMVEICWDRLDPPLDDDDFEVRAAPFNWLDDPDRGACFPHTVRKLPIVRMGNQGYGWIAWQQTNDSREGITTDELERVVLNATREHCQETYNNIKQSLVELQTLMRVLNAKLGFDAPGFTALRPAIEECLGMAKQILGRKGPGAAAAAEEVTEEVVTENGENVRIVVQRPQLNTRDDVYRQLAEAAAALQKLEPHSPVPFLVQRAVQLGSLPFPQLMQALIRDSNVLSEMNRELGLNGSSNNNNDMM